MSAKNVLFKKNTHDKTQLIVKYIDIQLFII